MKMATLQGWCVTNFILTIICILQKRCHSGHKCNGSCSGRPAVHSSEPPLYRQAGQRPRICFTPHSHYQENIRTINDDNNVLTIFSCELNSPRTNRAVQYQPCTPQNPPLYRQTGQRPRISSTLDIHYQENLRTINDDNHVLTISSDELNLPRTNDLNNSKCICTINSCLQTCCLWHILVDDIQAVILEKLLLNRTTKILRCQVLNLQNCFIVSKYI